MSDMISVDAARHRAFTKPSGPDLSQLPAYVEPPRQAQPRFDRPPRSAVLALTGTAFGTAVLLGWYLYASQPAAPITDAPPPPAAFVATAATSPRDVPLPDGVHYVAAPVSPPARTAHSMRTTHPSRG